MAVGQNGVNGVPVQLLVAEGTEYDLGLVTNQFLLMVVPIVQMISHLDRSLKNVNNVERNLVLKAS